MATRKRTASGSKRARSAKSTHGGRAVGTGRAIATQLAVRYRPGRLERVRAALEPFGTVEPQQSARIVILHRAPGRPREKLADAVARLGRDGDIEFASGVLRDRETGVRQVLTDEIVVRLKPGTARRTLASLKAEHGLTVCRRNEFEPTQYIVRVPGASGTETLEVAKSIDRRDDVEFASPNFLTDVKL